MRLRSLLHKELIQFFRDPVVLFLIFWLYTIEVVICAYALGMEMRDLPLAVVDADESPASRRLVDDFIAGGNFRLAAHLRDVAAAEPYLERGEAQAVLVIPVDFERELYRGGGQALQFLVDGSNANTAAVARGYALQTVEAFRMRQGTLDERPLATVVAQLRTWYNPDQTNVNFTVLAMIALAGLMIGVVHPAASIVVRRNDRNAAEEAGVDAEHLVAWLAGRRNLRTCASNTASPTLSVCCTIKYARLAAAMQA